MKAIFFLLGMAWAVHSPAAETVTTASRSRLAPAPLYRDPVHDGAADATLIWNRAEKCWWMLYTNRRADADDEKGVKWVHGTDIGIASTPDGGLTWTYRHTWLQIAQLGFDGNTLTCDRDAEVEIDLEEPAPEYTAEHIPGTPQAGGNR